MWALDGYSVRLLIGMTAAKLVMDSFVDVTAAKLVTQFAGVLALVVGTGFLARGSRAMMNGRLHPATSPSWSVLADHLLILGAQASSR